MFARGNLLSNIADIRDDECCTRIRMEMKVTIKIGNCTCVTAFYHDSSTNQRSFGVTDITSNLLRLLYSLAHRSILGLYLWGICQPYQCQHSQR